jgi:ribosomal protein S18 acetylase RimI-like enzyme
MLAMMDDMPPIFSMCHEPLDSGADALALAAWAWPEEERPGQLAALAELTRQGLAEQIILVAARRGRRLSGAILAQILAGRAAVVWPPQTDDEFGAETSSLLLAEMKRRLTAADVRLAQAILDGASGRSARALQSAGFMHVGDLAYMAAEVTTFPAQPPTLDFLLEPAGMAESPRLANVLEATYRGSLDCPLVDGLRPTADVLAGYRAVGQHRPEWWLIASEIIGGVRRDAGCLILADYPDQDQTEIVYLGVVAECRGRSWGLSLTRWAQWLARVAGRSRVVLAVDAENRPAITAYEQAGFAAWDRRSIFVVRLG